MQLVRDCFLGFIRLSAIAMGCFFGCFRIRDDHRHPTHLISDTLPSNLRGTLVSRKRIQLSSLLISEERDALPSEDTENCALDNSPSDTNVSELKDEAKFLKACGTLPATPAEIRNRPEKPETSKFHSWLPNAPVEKLNLDKQLDQSPIPVKHCEERIMGSGSLVHTPSSCRTVGQSTGTLPTSSIRSNQSGDASTPFIPLAASVQGRSKSVRFECNYNVSKASPYPTPLKLSDEMQTPGTAFPSYVNTMANRKNPKIRTQSVYSVLNAVENFSQWKALKEEDSNSNQLSDHPIESPKQTNQMSVNCEVGMREASDVKEPKVATSFSSWLKPQTSHQDESNQSISFISTENAHVGRTPGDRPILGMVAAHWDEDELSRVSPKGWDGNGIPNSTNKYNEDQKVSWHATPFEERLEKALSEETFISRRKHISGMPPGDYNEKEECDTAISQLQSSVQFNSVVSF